MVERERVYQVSRLALIRVCSLPVDFLEHDDGAAGAEVDDARTAVSRWWADPDIAPAIAIASPDLATAAASIDDLSDKRVLRCYASFRRYLLRMSARPTPFGLFVGIGSALFDGGIDRSVIGAPFSAVRRAAPFPVIEIRDDLCVVANPGVEVIGGVAWIPHADPDICSRRKQRPVRTNRVLQTICAAAGTPTTVAELADSVAPELGVPAERIRDTVGKSVESNLLVPFEEPRVGTTVTTDDPAIVRSWLVASDTSDVQGGANERPRTAFGIDGRLPGDEPIQLPSSLADQAAAYVDALTRFGVCSPYPARLSRWARRFTEHYGDGVEVALRTALSDHAGIGFPDAMKDEAAPLSEARSTLWHELVAEALHARLMYVDLDETWQREFDRVREGELPDDPRPFAPALDFIFCPARRTASSGAAALLPALASPILGGWLNGRFDQITAESMRRLRRSELRAAETAYADVVVADVRYRPGEKLRMKSQHVLADRLIREFDLPIGLPRQTDREHTIDLRDVRVGVDSGTVYLRWMATGQRLIASQSCSVNPIHAPQMARFLLEVSMAAFRWQWQLRMGAAAQHPFVPGVRFEGIELRPPMWRLPTHMLRPGNDDQQTVAWLKAFDAPDRLEIHHPDSDTWLPLDLADPGAASDLVTEIRKKPGSFLVPQYQTAQTAWLTDRSGRAHASEVVVTVRRTENGNNGKLWHQQSGREYVRHSTPHWHELQLDWPLSCVDTLIVPGLMQLCAELRAKWGVGRIWWMRYSVGGDHLRVRFDLSGLDDTARAELRSQLNRTFVELGVAAPREAHYRPETERYGAGHLLDLAHSIFAQDSMICAELLRRRLLRGERRLPIAVQSIAALVDQMIDRPTAVRLTHRWDIAPGVGGTEFRQWGRDLAIEVNEPRGHGSLYCELHDRWNGLPAKYADLVRLTECGPPVHVAIGSVVHMHANRLGLSLSEEAVAQGVWQRIVRQQLARDRIR